MSNYQTITPMSLGQAAIGTAVSTIYTAPALTLTAIQNIIVANTTGSSATYSIYLVPAAGTVGTSNAIFYNSTLAANTTFSLSCFQILSAGWTVQVQASTTGLTATVSGNQYV